MDSKGTRTVVYNEDYKVNAEDKVEKLFNTCNKYGFLAKTFATDYSLNKESINRLMPPLSNIVSFILHISIINVECLEAYLQHLKSLQNLCLSNVEIVYKELQICKSVSLNNLNMLFLDRVSDNPIRNFKLYENNIDTKFGFLSPNTSPDFELFRYEINAQLGLYSLGSFECLTNHSSIEELYFYNSHISLLKPFTKFYPTLKKIVTANYYQPILSQELLKVIQNNPQLSSIHIYTCEDPKLFIEAVLDYTSNINAFAIYSADNFEFSYYGNYLDFCNRYSSDSDILVLNCTSSNLHLFISRLIRRMPDLTLINITLSLQYLNIMVLIANEAENLQRLVLYSPFFGYQDAHSSNYMESFFKDIFYCLNFKSRKSLYSIEFIEFNILDFKIQYMSQFSNLNTVKFMYLLSLESKEEELIEIKSGIEAVKGWKSFHDYSTNYGVIEFVKE
jgi:hypothetical protein